MNTQPPDDPWFDEIETEEHAAPEPRWAPARPAPSPSSSRPHRQGRWAQPRILAAITVGLIAMAVLLASLAGRTARADVDRTYLNQLLPLAAESHAIGTALSALLESRSLTPAKLDFSLTTLTSRQARVTAEAASLAPAPTLRSEQANALESLQLRLSGVQGLVAGFRSTAVVPSTELLDALTADADRLIASDIVWHDLFVRPAQAQLSRDSANNLHPPSSVFVANPSLADPQTIAALLARLRTPTSQTSTTTTTTILKLGDGGPSVVAWQRKLNRWLSRQHRRATIKITSNYDQATVQATIQLQTGSHLTTDGIAGPITQAALSKALRQK